MSRQAAKYIVGPYETLVVVDYEGSHIPTGYAKALAIILFLGGYHEEFVADLKKGNDQGSSALQGINRITAELDPVSSIRLRIQPGNSTTNKMCTIPCKTHIKAAMLEKLLLVKSDATEVFFGRKEVVMVDDLPMAFAPGNIPRRAVKGLVKSLGLPARPVSHHKNDETEVTAGRTKIVFRRASEYKLPSGLLEEIVRRLDEADLSMLTVAEIAVGEFASQATTFDDHCGSGLCLHALNRRYVFSIGYFPTEEAMREAVAKLNGTDVIQPPADAGAVPPGADNDGQTVSPAFHLIDPGEYDLLVTIIGAFAEHLGNDYTKEMTREALSRLIREWCKGRINGWSPKQIAANLTRPIVSDEDGPASILVRIRYPNGSTRANKLGQRGLELLREIKPELFVSAVVEQAVLPVENAETSETIAELTPKEIIAAVPLTLTGILVFKGLRELGRVAVHAIDDAARKIRVAPVAARVARDEAAELRRAAFDKEAEAERIEDEAENLPTLLASFERDVELGRLADEQLEAIASALKD